MRWALFFLAAAGCAAFAPAPSASAANADLLAPALRTIITVGYETGRVTVRQLGPQIVLSGTFANEPPNVMQSAHLHKSPCGSHAPVLRELGNVTNGRLGTIRLPGLTIAQLRAMHASISVTRSKSPSSGVVSCGNL